MKPQAGVTDERSAGSAISVDQKAYGADASPSGFIAQAPSSSPSGAPRPPSRRQGSGLTISAEAHEEPAGATPVLPFFVVAIGASAGGLEALQEFFRQVSPTANLSFVVIQHLSPDFKSMMAELLSRQTRLRVKEIEDGSSPAPNCVHVIAPNRVLTLEDGRFKLVDREPARGLLAMNVFLTSLAETQGDQCAAIILSGTGSDGTHGARSIKEAGGLVMAQEPASAKFDGMPNSVIASGLVDFVGTPPSLAERLESYVAQSVERMARELGDAAGERQAFDDILRLLRQQSRLSFSLYKEGTVMRRVQRRAALIGEPTLESYLERLQGNPAEVELLTRELLIGVTQFFRDPAAWGYLEDTIIPELVRSAEERGMLRLWVAGCATGEEAYTLAILLEEHLQRSRRSITYRLFATDARRDSLRYARAGVYPTAACLNIPEPLRERYFESRGENLIAKRALRDAVTFAPHDVLADPPFTQLSFISCRNMLIYLKTEAQRTVLSRFRAALKEGGFLFLGASESVGESNPQFRALSSKANVFVARGMVGNAAATLSMLREKPLDLAPQTSPPPRSPRSTEVLYEAVIQRYVPPGVAVDANFELIQVFGNVADFVSIPPGRVTISLLKMVPRVLSTLLQSAGRKALSQGHELTIPDVRVPTAGGERTLSVRIVPIDDLPGVALGLMIFFEATRSTVTAAVDASAFDPSAQQHLRELEDELVVARESLNSAVQDLVASNEELQATNEELTASNEELQSTNEELQSVNEELYTVNSEYQEKIGELEELNQDLENLLRVVDAGVLFLDESLTVRRFNDSATRLLPLRPEDVGRPLGEIALQAEYRALIPDAQTVLETGERKLTSALGNDGAWWSIGLRPARDVAGTAGSGVIITMQEISELKRAFSDLSRLTQAHEMVETAARMGHAILDLTHEVVHYSQGALHLLGYPSPPACPLSLPEAVDLFAAEASGELEARVESVRRAQGSSFTTEREISTARGTRVRLALDVQEKQDVATGARFLVAVLQRA